MPKVVNLINMEFGRLTVKAKAESKCTGGKTMYICECDCTEGATITVRGTNLTTGRTTSCGCQKSIGEANITKILTENGRTYAREYTFTDCTDKGKLRFDFAVMDENNTLLYLIEFDGIQHTQAGTGWNTEEAFQNTKRRDTIKNEYCKANNITLIRIPHTEAHTITIEMLTPETTAYKM